MPEEQLQKRDVRVVAARLLEAAQCALDNFSTSRPYSPIRKIRPLYRQTDTMPQSKCIRSLKKKKRREWKKKYTIMALRVITVNIVKI
jgi:hypothetical protein